MARDSQRTNTLEKNQILRNKIRLGRVFECIYFLISKDEIVYIGQSTQGLSRILAHTADKDKEFDSYYYVECNHRDLARLEAEYIIKFKPIGNKGFPKNDIYKSLPMLKSIYDINMWKIKKIITQYKLTTYLVNNIVYIEVPKFDMAYKKYLSELESD